MSDEKRFEWQCCRCHWFVAESTAEPHKGDWGRCHLNPPVLVDPEEGRWNWPRVKDEDFCGDFWGEKHLGKNS